MFVDSHNFQLRLALCAVLLFLVITSSCIAQTTGIDTSVLREEIARKGYSFTISDKPVIDIPLENLCGVDLKRNVETGPKVHLGAQFQTTLPAAFDWRDQGYVSPVKEQGCGDCWAHTIISVLESVIYINHGVTVDLSEQWLNWNNPTGFCTGGFANRFSLCANGAVLESDCPYIGSSSDPDWYKEPFRHCFPISGYYHPVDSPAWTSLSVYGMKRVIYEHGPVWVSLSVGPLFGQYSGGIFDAYEGGSGHAITVVGWDDTQGPYGIWIVKNSWGTRWGEQGYMRYSRELATIRSDVHYVTMD